MRALMQRAMCCPCGRGKTLALGLCPTCYTLKRQDEAYFGGLRETVLERDGHRCRGCGRHAAGVRSILVHHRRPGISKTRWMLTLCFGCHTKIHRTIVLRSELTPLLLILWRELHPRAHHQLTLRFAPNPANCTFRQTDLYA